MKKSLIPTSLVFIIVLAGSFIAKKYGLYYSYFYTDIILHLLSGFGLALLWLWFTASQLNKTVVYYSSLVTFPVFGSFIWELWEFWGWKLTPWLTRDYIPTLSDSLGDITMGLIGGLIVAIIHWYKLHHIKSKNNFWD